MTKLTNIVSKDTGISPIVDWVCDCCKCEVTIGAISVPKGWKITWKSMKYTDREVLCNKCVKFKDIIK
jgi:hypothetical protein